MSCKEALDGAEKLRNFLIQHAPPLVEAMMELKLELEKSKIDSLCQRKLIFNAL